MSSLVEVSFKGHRREFFHWEGDELLSVKMGVIVEADRGEDLGFIYATGELALKRAAGVPHRPTEESPVTQAVKRTATADELEKVAELREQDELARRKAMERVKANNLVMKLTDAEWRWDRRKLTIYFTAEKRVDFRNLVRELASMFRTRIELKQIGVRDEAKRLGGIGRCAREYCSAAWLPELRPVNLGVAKDQRLSLNPTQISGACGRLMCCLRYEHEFYVQQRKRFPKEQKIIETSKGEEKVISNDIFRERVTLRGVDGEVRTIELAELRREWRNPSSPGQLLDEDTTSMPDEAISDEVLRMQDTSEMPVWRPDLRRDGMPRGGLPVLPPPQRPTGPPARETPDADPSARSEGARSEGAPSDPERSGRGGERNAERRGGAGRRERDQGSAGRKS
ncbi:MAG: regulatory iron-sulfur-containing complex subunit RicT, partial [Gemmatimonadota bacterium]